MAATDTTSTASTSLQRAQAIERLRTQRLDALIVGGGIVGAGIARDLALRGGRVGLVEQEDLASGTSSRPTRLIHGGLRYLEIYDFGLVRKDLREREILLRVAPHLVFPLPFLLPQYGQHRFYAAKLRAGMQLYDLLSFDKSLPGRRWLRPDEVRAVEPAISTEGLQGAWRYYDAQVPLVERMVVENALDAATHGAVILNHARVERFLRHAGSIADQAAGDEGSERDRGATNGSGGTVPSRRVTGAVVRDLLSGQEIEVRARLTINATGPWLDETDGELRPGKPPLLRLTKGVHLVTPSGTRNAHVLFSQSDGRLFFVVPWLGYSMVGTTDTDFHGDPADAAADAEDVRYLSTEARRAFPSAPFDEIYYAYAGVRALARVEGVREGKVSRKHKVLDHEAREGLSGIVSVVGGKITAHRDIAEEVGDLAMEKLGRRARSYTDRRPYPGGALADLEGFVGTEIWPRAKALNLTSEQASRLGRIYGSLALDVLALAERDRSLAQPVAADSPAIRAEVVRAVEQEWAVSLSDFLLRRSDLGLLADQALGDAGAFAEAMGDLLGWDATDQEEQVARYQEDLAPMRRFSTTGKAGEAAHASEPRR